MQRHLIILLLVCMAWSLVSCAQEEQILPTLIPSPTEEIITEAPTPIPLQRSTLPPTWTPAVEATNTPEPTIDINQVQDPQAGPPTPLEVCATFGEDRTLNKRTYTFGVDAQVHWTPVQGAAFYSIMLVDATGEALFTDYTSQTTFTFSADLFEKGKLYGWEVSPVDSAGQQMCLARGAELFPDAAF